MNGYLIFNMNGRSVRVAFFQGEPRLYAELKAGFLPFDKEVRWRSILSKRRQKEIFDFLDKNGVLKEVKEHMNEAHE